MDIYRVAALRDERAEVLRFCAQLSEPQWRSDSAAAGWRVQDVVAHMGASCRALFTPAALTLVRTDDIESANDTFVDRRRNLTPQQVLSEYERWSAWVIRLARVVSKTPMAGIRSSLGELGRFRLDRMLTSALVFDTHTHLRHDIASSLGLPAPSTDANRMAVVLEWMLAVLGNQLRAAPTTVPGAVRLVLTGPGGGEWVIGPDGAITAGRDGDAVAVIRGAALDFPSWATTRSDWRAGDLVLDGDIEAATRFLDAMDIV
ncbi:maleylpyruvate isomerase family mycothiol-dependent enzyme [Nocardia higoensis]|uniref:maleylpyruvate isomerase family mycothiol-dependent enzyme n=1 Tax=Nocardia higoensis TaxID=228599 RepID=UPI0002E363ED|nr:maleylpyruvate isomerase family mycothiol-dependent enzyme [Nocardia higoensis]